MHYAEQSCGRSNAFFTSMNPLRTGMIPPQRWQPYHLLPGTPSIAWLCATSVSTPAVRQNHLGDHTDALPTAHGFHEFWGYLYHLDAMQGVASRTITRPRPADRRPWEHTDRVLRKCRARWIQR
jgi:arylsulfatase